MEISDSYVPEHAFTKEYEYPSICVFMVMHNQWEYTERFLECWQQHTYPTNELNLVIFDNGSDSENSEQLRKWLDRYPNISNHTQLLRSETNLLYAEAIHRCLMATGDVTNVKSSDGKTVKPFWLPHYERYAFLNNDILFTPEGFNHCVRLLDHYDMVGPRTNNCAGIQNQTKMEHEGFLAINTINKLVEKNATTYELWKELEVVNNSMTEEPCSDELLWINGFAMFIGGDALAKISAVYGPIVDYKTFPLSGEEIDLCYRGKAIGLEYQVANAYFWHFKHATVKHIPDGEKYWKDSAAKLKSMYPGLFPKQFGTELDVNDAIRKAGNS